MSIANLADLVVEYNNAQMQKRVVLTVAKGVTTMQLYDGMASPCVFSCPTNAVGKLIEVVNEWKAELEV